MPASPGWEQILPVFEGPPRHPRHPRLLLPLHGEEAEAFEDTLLVWFNAWRVVTQPEDAGGGAGRNSLCCVQVRARVSDRALQVDRPSEESFAMVLARRGSRRRCSARSDQTRGGDARPTHELARERRDSARRPPRLRARRPTPSSICSART
jgi:hypothetical protein